MVRVAGMGKAAAVILPSTIISDNQYRLFLFSSFLPLAHSRANPHKTPPPKPRGLQFRPRVEGKRRRSPIIAPVTHRKSIRIHTT